MYDPFTNTLNIPAPITRQPFYDVANPRASNYGNLGYMIAHELAHSLGNYLIKVNSNIIIKICRQTWNQIWC